MSEPFPAPECARAGAGHWSIELRSVCFAYSGSAPVFSNFNLRITPGSRIAVMGRSGSGKTTLLRTVSGALRATEGERLVFGTPRVGVLPQEDAYLPWRSVWRNVKLLKSRQMNEAALRAVLASVGLPVERYGERIPEALSGGERRRLGLAMVLASAPDLVLLDEAGSSLDETTRFAIDDEILQATRRFDAGLFAITHDAEEALLLGDTLLIVRGDGRIEQRQIELPPERTSELRFSPMFQALRADVLGSLRA